MINCPNCKSPNDEDNQFCGKCGAKLPDPKYCLRCYNNSYNDDFCTKCGEKLVSKEEFEKISQKTRCLLQQSREFKDKNDFDEALKCFDEILKIRPGHILSLNEKRNIFAKLGKYEDAIECCDKLIESDSKDNFSFLFKGDYLNELGKIEEAIECYDKSILIDSNYHSPYIHKGKSLLELGKFDDALYCFDKGLKIKNDDPFYFSLVVTYLCNFFKFEEAIEYCERGLNYYPQDYSLNFEKAKLLCLTGSYLDAKELILRYNLYCAKLFNSVADIFNSMGEYYKAKRYCNKAIDCDSQFYYSWLTKGEIYFNLKKYDESLIYFKKGFDLSDENKEKIVNGLNKNCQDFVKSNLF